MYIVYGWGNIKTQYFDVCACSNGCHLYYRKPSVVIKHSGLDESGASNESDDDDDGLIINSNGYPDVSRLPKG